jgi:hypothetical protein
MTFRLPSKILPSERRFYLVVSWLILLAGAVYFSAVGRVGFVTHDERSLNLEATSVGEHGLSQLFAKSDEWSRAQGRVGFRIMFVPIIGAYLVDSSVRPELITFVQILAYIAIALFLSFYLGVPTALLVLAFFLCFLTHPGHHYPDAANPLVFHLELALFFIGATLRMWARQAQSRRTRYVLTASACALVFLGVSFYESVFVVCALVECAIIYSLSADVGAAELAAAESSRKGRGAAIRKAVRLEAPVLGTLFVYAILYAGFRVLHPSGYEGNTMEGAFHFGVVTKAVFVYGIGGLPGVNWFLGRGSVLLGRELAQGVSVPVFLIRHLGWPENVLGLGIAVSVWLYVRHWATWAPTQTLVGLADTHSIFFWRRRGVLLAAVALFIAFAAQIPMALVSKYNQNPIAWAPHVSSLFGFLGFCIGVPALVMAIFAGGTAFRAVAALTLAVASFVLFVASREVSMLVVAEQERDYASSRMVDLFLKSKAFAAIPDNSLLVAPSLWETPTLDATSDAEYWEQYIGMRAGRSMSVQASLPDEYQIPRQPGGMYYIEHQRSPGGPRLLISQFYRRPAGAGLASNSLTVLSQDAMEDGAVVFQQALDTASPKGVDAGMLQAAPLQSHYDGSVFFATIAVPDGFIPGTAYVVSREAAIGASKLKGLGRGPYEAQKYALSAKVRIEFGDGFHPAEQSDKHYWHWSNGPSGTGAVTLWNQTESPLKIVFQACIATGYAAPSRTLLRWGGESAVFTSNKTCSPFSQALTLAPGKNSLSIHSDAARLPTAQTDSRYIVFGVFDWKVRDPNATLPAPEQRSDPLQDPASGNVRIEFGNGFSGPEHSHAHYWRWSAGRSGTGEVIFWNQTSQQLKVHFNACVKTGFAEPSRLTLGFQGKQDVLTANNTCAPVDREWALAPGKNTLTIHSDAPNLPTAPGDPRYIVFGLFDWKLTSSR